MASPVPCAFWPLTVVAGSADTLDVAVGGSPIAATVAPATYLSAWDLATAVRAALLDAYPGGGWSVGVSAIGQVTISASVAWTAPFGTGANAFRSLAPALGFDAADDSTAATSRTGAHQHVHGWYAVGGVQDDTGDLPAYTRSLGASLFGRYTTLTHGRYYTREIKLGLVPEARMFLAAEQLGNEALERLFSDGWGRFRWWDDVTQPAVFGDYVLDHGACTFTRARLDAINPRYMQTLTLRSMSGGRAGAAWQGQTTPVVLVALQGAASTSSTASGISGLRAICMGAASAGAIPSGLLIVSGPPSGSASTFTFATGAINVGVAMTAAATAAANASASITVGAALTAASAASASASASLTVG